MEVAAAAVGAVQLHVFRSALPFAEGHLLADPILFSCQAAGGVAPEAPQKRWAAVEDALVGLS